MNSALDEAFRLSIKNDFEIFDNKVTLEVLHYEADAKPDFTTGKSNRTIKSTTVDGCLFRQASLRNGPSVPQLHQRDVAVQKDSFVSIDVVIEIPMVEIKDEDGVLLFRLEIKDEDTIRDNATNREWKVLSVDYSTLNTRYRLGVTRLR